MTSLGAALILLIFREHFMSENLYLIAALVALAVSSGGLLGWQLRKFFSRLEALEDAQNKRQLPNRAKDALEDMMAIAMDAGDQNQNVDRYIQALVVGLMKSEAARDYQHTSIERLKNIAKTLRADPRSYDPDQPNQFKDVLKETQNE